MRLLLFCLCILSIQSSIAQKRAIIGRVTDMANGSPLEQCTVIDTLSGGSAMTDKNGKFRITTSFSKAVLVFRRLGYRPKLHDMPVVQDSVGLSIQLEPQHFVLNEAIIVANPVPEVMLKNEEYYISDFEFAPENRFVVLSAVLGKNYSFLMLLDSVYQVIKKVKIKDSYIEILRDCIGNLNLVAGDSVQQFYINEKEQIVQFPPIPSKEFNEKIKPCVAYSEKYGFYFKKYGMRGQVASFYSISNKSEYANFRTISSIHAAQLKDEEKFLGRVFNTRMGQQGTGYIDNDNSISEPAPEMGSEAAQNEMQRARNSVSNEKRFAENILYKEFSCPLFLKRDSFLLFDHSNDNLYFLNHKGMELGAIPIQYHHAMNWEKEVYEDREERIYYTSFNIKGLTTLFLINTYSGKLGASTKVPLPYPHKLKIKNGVAYYLAIEDTESRNKILYKIRMNR
jgi:hypothetical protein